MRSALIIALVLCLAGPATHARQPTDPTREANRLSREGARLYQAERYVEAAELFGRAYGIHSLPKYLVNQARCLDRHGDDEAVLGIYERLVTDHPTADVTPGVREAAAEVRDRLGTTRVEVTVRTEPEGAVITLDDDPTPLGRAPVTRWLPFGAHTLTLRLDGHLPERRAMALAAGAPHELLVRLVPVALAGRILVAGVPDGALVRLDGHDLATGPPGPIRAAPGAHRLEVVRADGQDFEAEVQVETGGDHHLTVQWRTAPSPGPDGATDTLAYGLLGGGGAVVIGGAVAGILGYFVYRRDAEDFHAATRDGPVTQADQDVYQGKIQQTEDALMASYICYGLGGAAMVTGLILALMDGDGGGDTTATPTAGPGLAGVGLRVGF